MIDLITKPQLHYQLTAEQLVAQTLQRGEGVLNSTGALVVNTGTFTGRSPADKFIVKDQTTESAIHWNKFNHPLEPAAFLKLQIAICAYLNEKAEIWVRDAFACANPGYRLSVRVITETPWSNHFTANMFINPQPEELKLADDCEWQVIQAPGFQAIPEEHGTRKGNFTVISFAHKTILIGGTGYTGEIKKAVFTVLNYLLPGINVLPMHCSINEGKRGDTALFFGLSGTGKTTLSSDSDRLLVGDDEHGWDDDGTFNFEGGCYAKIINLSAEHEPQIYKAIKHGALVENAGFIPGTNHIDYSCKKLTENTRVSYPLSFINNAKTQAVSSIPKNIFFLTCDAYGVLPPISRLSAVQAMYHYLNGYTAKIAGTEEGILEPQITFSACFGAPFLPLHPHKYAELFGYRMKMQSVKVWMVNTGWCGGPYGTGSRIKLAYTRAMITAALDGRLDHVSYVVHPFFDMLVPQSCPEVPELILNPRDAWPDVNAYDLAALELKRKFQLNYEEVMLDGMVSSNC
ncbi:phosphoenolpyruvate carboxykinase (ATP) [Mucilaginibacter flavus]|uniref:phosphoenolpyruvate carboxykinase (ATP) n=1 Tax=Mucilaginibacter flavus TaxID=931504 RepID=UPI0025B4C093|nr:phosphoenolpyruvate carboxykinase (ATP) [Mucilaginibacter flavus]MDN3584508.1 phosphoenolpyruvate carboxykinase (ATP) [Mucilaginibacter flavus]